MRMCKEFPQAYWAFSATLSARQFGAVWLESVHFRFLLGNAEDSGKQYVKFLQSGVNLSLVKISHTGFQIPIGCFQLSSCAFVTTFARRMPYQLKDTVDAQTFRTVPIFVLLRETGSNELLACIAKRNRYI